MTRVERLSVKLQIYKIEEGQSTCRNDEWQSVRALCADPEGEAGGRDTPWKITNIWGSLAILVWIPLKSQSYQSSIQCWAIIGPVAKRHLNGVSLAGRWWPAHSGICILPPLIKLNKNVVKVGPPLTKTFWIRAWSMFNDLSDHLLRKGHFSFSFTTIVIWWKRQST